MLLRFVLWMFSAVLMLLGASGACGQGYPTKPIRIVTPGSGGGADFAARLIAPGLTAGLGQRVIVDNRPSAVIPGEIVSKAPPDGYTLLIYGPPFWIGPLLQKTPYDPVRDFQPITAAVRQPNILVVHPSLPVKSVKELIALAKARPGALNYASIATGSSSHLAGELFKAMTGVSLVRISYKGSGAALVALLAGEVELSFANAVSVMGAVRSGKLRALAVTTAQPSPLAPGLPTVAASGLPGYESVIITAVFAPAATPAAIIHRLNREIVAVLNKADIKEKFFNAGSEVVGSSPEELTATIKSEMSRMSKVIKEAGIKAD
ncbi:MAG: tripartite tricarboxylate transporter substrate binding protein [Betaproteobacteria bacterium]|nr:tripartite tricarboxylate transporter substrate binding protein [Betaproteobacteria bacterium]